MQSKQRPEGRRNYPNKVLGVEKSCPIRVKEEPERVGVGKVGGEGGAILEGPVCHPEAFG